MKVGYCFNCGLELSWNRGKTYNRIEDKHGRIKLFCDKCHKKHCDGEGTMEYFDLIENRFEILDL